jgi:hypothetical protein
VRIIIFVYFALGCALAYAGESAYTVRVVPLKSRPFSDAPTLANLPTSSKVEILSRQTGWTQVKSGGTTGWVKMLSLRLDAGASQRRGDSGLGSLFNVASTGRSSSTVTTGVRGLSEEQLKNTKPNPQALQAGKAFVVGKSEAQRFAEEGGLHAQHLDYLAAPNGGQ